MRDLRNLPPAPEQTGRPRAQASSWTLAQRLLFAAGLAIAVYGLARAAYFEFGRANLDTREVADWDANLDTDLALLENMNLEEAWDLWLAVRDSDIGPFSPPQYVQARMLADFLKSVVFVSAVIGLFGLSLMGIAVILPRITGRGKRTAPSR
jgi:hypothetical protein